MADRYRYTRKLISHCLLINRNDRYIEQRMKNMLKDMDFCHLQEIYLTNIENNY